MRHIIEDYYSPARFISVFFTIFAFAVSGSFLRRSSMAFIFRPEPSKANIKVASSISVTTFSTVMAFPVGLDVRPNGVALRPPNLTTAVRRAETHLDGGATVTNANDGTTTKANTPLHNIFMTFTFVSDLLADSTLERATGGGGNCASSGGAEENLAA